MNQDLKKHIENWLQKAEKDLLTAQRLIEIEPMILDNACFHCQQAMEKYLKAYLISHQQHIERTHNIDFLLAKCMKHDPVFGEIDPREINDFAVRVRYPDMSIIPDYTDVKMYYQMAEEIRALVLDRINFS